MLSPGAPFRLTKGKYRKITNLFTSGDGMYTQNKNFSRNESYDFERGTTFDVVVTGLGIHHT